MFTATTTRGQPQEQTPPPEPLPQGVTDCIDAGSGHPDPSPGCPWQVVGQDYWVDEPRLITDPVITVPRPLGSETVRYRYEGSFPVPCGVPLSLRQIFENERTVTHRVHVDGSYSATLGISAEVEAGYKRLLAARVATAAAATVELGAGWSGTWEERVLSRQEVDVAICHEVVRTASVEEVQATMVRDVMVRLYWHVTCGSTPFNTTTDCRIGEYRGNATGFQNRIIDVVTRRIQDPCPLGCI